MNELIFIASALLLIMIGFLKFATTEVKKGDKFQYKLKGPIISGNEIEFRKTVLEILPPEYILICKVRLADVIEPKMNKKDKMWLDAYSSVASKYFDFVVVNADTFKPEVAINIDTRLESGKTVRRNDAFTHHASSEVGLTLLSIGSNDTYRPSEIKGLLSDHINLYEIETVHREKMTDSEKQLAKRPKPEPEKFMATSMLARKMKIDHDELLENLVQTGFLKNSSEGNQLTEKAESIGAVYKQGICAYRYEWPSDISLAQPSQ